MVCYHPLDAFHSVDVSELTGKRTVVFKPPSGSRRFEPIKVPCGQCIGCRLERSRKWALRCVHEASLYERNCFITLTYDNDHLPIDNSLDVSHFQLFMKRLRKRFGKGIRFFHCGEYGEKFGRPHYHAILFNFDFEDKQLWKLSDNGTKLFVSKSLSELWPMGFSTIGDCTFESAAYVARYVLKKINGEGADARYYNPEFGSFIKPEYVTMSRRPGIGRGWYDKYSTDVFPSDFLVVNGVKCKPPRFYDKILEVSDPSGYEVMKDSRKAAALLDIDNSTPERLKVREHVEMSRLSTLKREIE